MTTSVKRSFRIRAMHSGQEDSEWAEDPNSSIEPSEVHLAEQEAATNSIQEPQSLGHSKVKLEPLSHYQSSVSNTVEDDELIENVSGDEQPVAKRPKMNNTDVPTVSAETSPMRKAPLSGVRGIGHYACIGCRTLVTHHELLEHHNRGCGNHKPISEARPSDLPPRHNGQFCSDCLMFVPTSKMLCRHQQDAHGLDTPVEEILLADETEFEIFYDWLQSQAGLKFVPTKCRKSRDTSTIYRFFGCTMVSRAHNHFSRKISRVLNEDERVRLYGRLYLSCTAFLKKVPQHDGTIVVEYCAAHSHPIDQPHEGQLSITYTPKGLYPEWTSDTDGPPVGRRVDPSCSLLTKGGASKVSAAKQRRQRNFSPAGNVEEEDEMDDYVNVDTFTSPERPTTAIKPAAAVTPRTAKTRGRKPKETAASQLPPAEPRIVAGEPIEHVKNSLEVIFEKLADLPSEMIQQFIPILNDLALDASDAYDRFEDLKRYQPKRSLCRFQSGNRPT